MIRLRFLACLAALAGLLALPAIGSDAVLDRPAPPALRPPFATLRARLEALQRNFPLRVDFPPGLAAFVTQIDREPDPANLLRGQPLDGLSGHPPPDETNRQFLDRTCRLLGLRWRYDPARDVVATDFAWRREDPRSPVELLRTADFTVPTGMFGDDPWNQREWGPLTLTENDPALQAFDALLSKPQNFPAAWKLRFLESTRGPRLPADLWRGLLRDAAGHARFVCLRYLGTRANPALLPGYAGYVFDDQGRFLSGALFADRYHAAGTPSVLLSRDRTRLYLTRQDQIIGTLRLAPEGLVLRPAQTSAGDPFGHVLWSSP